METAPPPRGLPQRFAALRHAKVVPWMRKTEYISTEFNRYGVSNEKPEVKIGVSVKQQFTEEEIYKDRDSQIAAIEKTFEDAQKQLWDRHIPDPRWLRRGEEQGETLPGPRHSLWINPCAQVIFDSDPAPKDTSGAAALEMMSQAMIRGMMDEEGNQFVAYFLPVEETLRKRKRDQDEEMDYAPEDMVRLSKRRAKAGVQSGTNAVLVVKHRDMNEKELEAQEARRAQLENHEPEEEEEEDLELEKEAQGSDEEREKGSESEREAEAGGSEDEAGAGGSEEDERAARDQEEIFGSDDDDSGAGEDDDEDDEEEDGEGSEAEAARSASPSDRSGPEDEDDEGSGSDGASGSSDEASADSSD
ncbi:RNA polymerase II-associated factor 1 homolog [Alligator sinensis]|uniref:RNA polymerase II-associated factor 1 homolog n=1 Tax=Alligator sinensis TaxID=38654 RepID=A0A1U8DNJ9_ALLSI|nr:RNA polymerase II-associated factor 1 homolog [Alligator sinensis]